MAKFVLIPVAIITALLLLSVPADKESAKPYGLKKRIPWTTSRVVGTPEPPPPYKVARVFPKLKFDKPVFIAQEPGSGRFMVAELPGKIYAFHKDRADAKSRQFFLDTKRQIYAFSFHPNYEKNGQVFVFSPQPKKSRVSRFVAKGKPRCCDPKSEKIIVEWPSGGHNGGEAIIGPDGYLYIATGDGTSTSDENNTGQGVNDLLAVIMRLDVDNPAKGKPYSIPKDNPFVNYPGARPEIWAFGFRNPWRMSFDAQSGGLWVGDVGQDLWEMIRLVKRGGNYGWSVQEGSHSFHPKKTPGPGPILPPVVEHHHAECRSITGGYVYYGKKFPELHGIYFYGDYEYGKIWGLRYDPEKAKQQTSKSKRGQGVSGRETQAGRGGNPGHIIHSPNVIWHKELADTALRITSFCVTREGDIYTLDHTSGEVYELQRAQVAKPKHPFPRKLSETGLFTSVADHKVAPGVIPFTVNTPGWLDGADSVRFLGLPGNAKISVPGNDVSAWSPDDGAVTVQTVSLDMESGNPKSRRRIETRIMVKQENHWLGYSYLWNKEQTDAELVEALGREIVFNIRDRSAPGGRRRHTWRVPSRNECMFCHSRAAGFVLGLRTVQLNKDHDYGGVTDNQIRAFNHIGLFKKLLVEQSLHGAVKKTKKGRKARPDKQPSDYKAFAKAYDAKADLGARARAYLHVNCSICHDGSGGGNSKFEIRYDKKIDKARLLNQPAIHGDFSLKNGQLVATGDPFASVLFYRVSKLGRGRMPHIGSRVIDERGLDLLFEWITCLTPKGDVRPKNSSPPREDYVEALKTLTRTKQMTASKRTADIRHLLSTTRGAFITARIVSKEKLPGTVRKKIVAAAIAHADANVRDLFERFIPEERRSKRLGDFIRAEEILSVKGDPQRGRKLFFTGDASLCRSCHRINGIGGELGPDLSEIGKKNKRHEILESLIHPSRKIEEKYKTHHLITNKGKVLSGIVMEKTPQHVLLNVLDGNEAKQLRIPAKSIVQLLPQTKSLMPDGLLRDMTAQQAADMLAFLVSLKSRQRPLRHSRAGGNPGSAPRFPPARE